MMRHLTLTALVAALLVLAACSGGGDAKQETPRLTTLEPGLQQACYAIGVDLGRQIAGMPGASDFGQLTLGIEDFLANQPKLDFDAAREIMAVMPHAAGEAEAEAETHDHPDTWTARGFASEAAQTSYAVGVTVGQFVQMQIADPDVPALLQGMKDKMDGGTLLIDETQTRDIVTAYQQEYADKLGIKNKAEGEAFLIENAKKDGVKTTDSGLQYLVLKEGDGSRHPSAESTVKVHYHGTLINGEVFDSSVDRGEPISFPLNRVIAGWTEGVQLMTPGAKYRFFIPAELAYGSRGAGAKIGPNATLIFDVELLEIQ
ncbi:MAG: FKBP-type peptidyl-prolyl cis-trans isomerase [Candidatus Krumholzibacteriia bacterium]